MQLRGVRLPPHQEGVRNGVRHGDAGERDREHFGACHGIRARPGAAALVQDIRLIGIQVGHDLWHAWHGYDSACRPRIVCRRGPPECV